MKFLTPTNKHCLLSMLCFITVTLPLCVAYASEEKGFPLTHISAEMGRFDGRTGAQGRDPVPVIAEQHPPSSPIKRLVNALFPPRKVIINTTAVHQQGITNAPQQFSTNGPGIPPPSYSASPALRAPEALVDTASLIRSLHAKNYIGIVQSVATITPAQLLNANPLDSAIFNFLHGYSLFKLGQYEEAQETLQKLVDVEEPTGASHFAFLWLGYIATAQNDHERATAMLRKAADSFSSDNALAKATKIKIIPLQVVQVAIAHSLKSMKDFRGAEFEFQSALKHADKNEDFIAINTSIGNLYQEQGEEQKAIEYYEKTRELAEQIDDMVSIGWIHGNIGNAYLGLDKKDEALKHLQKSLELTLEHEHSSQALSRAYNNLGSAYQAVEDYEKAEDNYETAYIHAIFGNDPNGQARALGNKGNVLTLQKNYDKAIRCYSDSLELPLDSDDIRSDALRAIALHNRGCAYYERAAHIVETLHKELQTIPQLHQRIQNQGARHIQGDPLIAIMEVHRQGTEDISQAHTDSLNKATTYLNLAVQDLQEVVDGYEKKIKILPPSSHFYDSILKQNQRTFHRLQDSLMLLGEPQEALMVADQSRSRRAVESIRRRNWYSLTLPLTRELIIETMEIQGIPTIQFSNTGQRLIVWHFNPNRAEKTKVFSFFLENEDTSKDDTNILYRLIKQKKSTSDTDNSFYEELDLSVFDPLLLQEAEELLRPLTTQLQKDAAKAPTPLINLIGEHAKLLFDIICNSTERAQDPASPITSRTQPYSSVAHMAVIADQEDPIPFTAPLTRQETNPATQ